MWWAVVFLIIPGTLSLEEITQLRTPIASTKYAQDVQLKGAILISPIDLSFIDLLCFQITDILKLSTKIIERLNRANFMKGEQHQVRKTAYILLKLETKMDSIIKYVGKLTLCNNMQKIYWERGELKHQIGNSWVNIKLRKEETMNLMAAARPPKEVQNSPLILGALALGTGLVGGGLLSSIFGSKDHTEEINTLNNNIHKVNKRIQITSQRLDVLSQNISKTMTNIKTILDRMQNQNSEQQIRNGIFWNLNQILNSAQNIDFLIRLSETSITLLRKNIINIELIDVENIRSVVKEGLKTFKDLKFPLNEISKHTLPNIVKIMDIQEVRQSKFMAILPLVEKTTFEIYGLIPLPIQIKPGINTPGILSIAETNEIILFNQNNYIIVNEDDLTPLTNTTYLLNTIKPRWLGNQSTCEWEAFNKNNEGMLKQCHFKKIGLSEGIYLTERNKERYFFSTKTKWVILNCPDGQIRSSLRGLYKIPQECDLETDTVKWPAKIAKHINIVSILDTRPKEYDITYLPLFTLNHSSAVHESIKTLIDEIPDSTESFTGKLQNNDWTLEEIKPISIMAYGVLSILVITNSIILGILILLKCRKVWRNRNKLKEQPRKLRNSLREKIIEIPIPSRESLRNTWDRTKHKFTNTRDSLRARKKSHWQDNRQKSVGTNTNEIELNNIYPNIREVTIKPAIPSFN